MHTSLPTVEIVAGAVPLTGVEADMVRVVVTAERERDPVDRDAIELARVAVRLLDLADQGAVHRRIPPQPARGASRGRRFRSCTRPVWGGRGPHDTPGGRSGHPPKSAQPDRDER